MPYIEADLRKKLDPSIEQLARMAYTSMPQRETRTGILNYIITRLLLEEKPQRYDDYNRLIGVLEACKLEFYRKAVAPYEFKKSRENGDVYA